MENNYRIDHEIVALNWDKNNADIAKLLNAEFKLKGDDKYTAKKVSAIKGVLTKQYTGKHKVFKTKNALVKYFQKQSEERLRISNNENLKTKRVEFLNKHFNDGKFSGDSTQSVFEKFRKEFSKEKIFENLTVDEFTRLLAAVWNSHYADNFSKSGKFVVKELAEKMLLTRFPADFVANGLKKLYGNEPQFDKRVPDLMQKIVIGGFADELVSDSHVFSSKENPIIIPSEEKGGLFVMNGLHIGIIDSDLLENNSVVLGSRLARETNAAAMIIENPFELAHISKKSSGSASHIQRGVISNLDLSYLKKHGLLSKKISEHLNSDIDYVTPLEKFIAFLFHTIGSFNKPAANKEGGWEPIYPGPIYFVLGAKEDQLIKQIADDEMSLRTKRLQAELEMRKKMDKMDPQEVADLTKRIIRSNESEPDRNKIELLVRNIFIQLLQIITPNVRVAGFSEAYFVFKGKKVKSVTDNRETSQDNSLAKYTKHLREQAREGSYVPDAVLIGAPASIRCSTTVVELELLKNQPNVYAFQLPTCVNKKFLKSYLKQHPSIKYPIKKLVDNDCFEPGVMTLDVLGNGFTHGVISFEHLISIAAKKNIRKWKPGTEQSFGGAKYMNMYVDTDQHYGSPDQAWVKIPELDESLPIGEAFKYLYLRDKVSGIHLISHNDDPTQGQMPFLREGEKLARRSISPIEFQEKLKRFSKGIKDGISKKELEDLHQFFERHHQTSGIPDANTQIVTAVDSMVRKWADFYYKVYLDGKKAGVRVVGPGVMDGVFDSRDLGLINFGSGNHWFMDQGVLEGTIFAQRAILELIKRGVPEDEAKEVIKSPGLAMDPSVGYGRIGIGDNFDKYKYVWYLRNRPAKKSVDFLNATKNEMNDLMLVGERSLVPNFSVGLHLIQTLGDKHMHSASFGENVTCVMSGPGTRSNNYMEKGGFVPHNTGVAILSFPVDGPQAGPIFVTFYTFDMIQKAALGIGSMDWDKNHGLRNAV